MLQLGRPADGGMIYAETDLSNTFPEPLNTITSSLFFILALIWIIRLKGFHKKQQFLSVCSWVLLIGSIGGTIYHGFRRWPVFIVMDWLPIMILCLAASVYFWIRALGKWYLGALVFFVFMCMEVLIRVSVLRDNPQLGININYGLMALMVLLPVFILLIRLRWKNAQYILIALFSFSIALFFRVVDSWRLIGIGTHFLWHTFGAMATASMLMFIYELEFLKDEPGGKNEISARKLRKTNTGV